MSTIRLMSKELAEKIAAGEVVERPASIVKELVENSIDAHSSAITVEIREGGVSFIRVTDNGCGIPPEEVEMAFTRHATSKLYSEEELFDIKQLGFRGEALASIAAVSKTRMTSCVPTNTYGAEAVVEGGEIKSVIQTGCPHGTGIVVEDLFYNTPARRKFLKKTSQEAAHIGDILTRLILACPHISFKYISDGKTLLHSPGDGSVKNAIYAVYGRETAEHMLPVYYEQGEMVIEGFISDIELEKSNRTYQSLYINGRYIKDSGISESVQAGYINNIGTGKFPMYVLNIKLPGSMADVNVHPNKLEVRFDPQLNIFFHVTEAIKGTLQNSRNIPELLQEKTDDRPTYGTVKRQEQDEDGEPIDLKTDKTAEKTDKRETLAEQVTKETVSKTNTDRTLKDGTTAFNSTNTAQGEQYAYDISSPPKAIQEKVIVPDRSCKGTLSDSVYAVTGFTPHLQPVPLRRAQEIEQLAMQDDSLEGEYRLVGQMFLTYIVLEGKNTSYIVDQHAAHERLLYERLRKQVDESQVVSQQLLVSQILNLNYEEARKLENMRGYFEELGFEIEEFGQLSYAIRAVPVLLGKPNSAELILSMLDGTEMVRSPKASELLREKLIQTACKHAVKGGDALNEEEIEQLMRLIKDEEVPLSCPHGRPILIKLTKRELENKFKRNE